MMKVQRPLHQLAVAVALLVVASGCGSSFERADAIDRLVDEVGMTQTEASCTVEALESSFGSVGLLEDPELVSDAEAELIGNLMVGCIEPSLAAASEPAPEPAAVEPDETDEETDVDEAATASTAAVVAPGGAGDWTAAQLCSLADGEMVGAAFSVGVAAPPVEQFEDPSRSICAWNDPNSASAVPPALILADQVPSAGPLYIDGTSIDIAGADEVDYRPEWLPGEDFLVVSAAGQELTLRYLAGNADALDLATAMATSWANLQAG